MPYGLRLSEDELRSRLRQRIEDGELPVALSNNLLAAYGSGRICWACDLEIEPDHVEYEVTDPRDGSQLVFHVSCHSAWQLECARLHRDQDAGEESDTNPWSHP